MRILKFLFLIIINIVPLFTFGQEMVNRSRLTGIDLTLNSKKETRSNMVNKYLGRMDSFAIRNNFKLDKSSIEVLYTDADSLFNRLKQTGWNIITTPEESFYQLVKGNNKLLASVNYDVAISQINQMVGLSRKNFFPFTLAAVLLIRRR